MAQGNAIERSLNHVAQSPTRSKSKAGYIDARPLTTTSAKSTCNARPHWVNRVSLTAYPSLPVYPYEQTSSGSVSTSQTCHERRWLGKGAPLSARQSPLLLFRLRTDCLIDIERIRRLGFGVRLHEFRHDEYTRNRLLDYVDNRRFDLRSLDNHHFGLRCLLLGRRSPSSRSRLLRTRFRTRSPRLGACFLPFCFGLDRALRGMLLWRFRFLGGLFRCLFRRLCLPCYCPFGPFGHHTLALIERPPAGRGCFKYRRNRK